MTLKELENIIALRGEITQLSKSMDKHYRMGDFVGDFGINCGTGQNAPYLIQGVAVKDEPALERKKERLRKKVAELQSQVEAAERFIDEISDVDVRVLVRERVLNGATWEKSAKMAHGRMSPNAALQRVKRYFNAI